MKENHEFIEELVDLIAKYMKKGVPNGFIVANMEALKFRLLHDNLTKES